MLKIYQECLKKINVFGILSLMICRVFFIYRYIYARINYFFILNKLVKNI
jgi:hypothetical protein